MGSSRSEISEQNIHCISDHGYIMNSAIISECSSQIIIYIAGFVLRQLQITVKCEICSQALAGDKANYLNSLTTRESHGGLTYPSKDVCEVCKTTEHFLCINEHNIQEKNFLSTLKSEIMFNVSNSECFSCLNNHVLECSSNHIFFDRIYNIKILEY